jgi:hypothetical protein
MDSKIKFGVYVSPHGKLKVFEEIYDGATSRTHWELDEGMTKKHPLFRITVPVVKNMSVGWPVFEWSSDLKGYEYLGDL